MMIKEAYTQALRKLPVSIESEEGRELIPHLFPHLCDAEIREFLGPGVDCRTIALPPLRVDGAYQLVSFSPYFSYEERQGISHNKFIYSAEEKKSMDIIIKKSSSARLSWVGAGRTEESYAGSEMHNYAFPPYKHIEQAVRFARENWGEELVLDSWVEFCRTYLEDPSQLKVRFGPMGPFANVEYLTRIGPDGKPEIGPDGKPAKCMYHKDPFDPVMFPTKMAPAIVGKVYFGITRKLEEIFKDASKPERFKPVSQMINDSVAEITTSEFVAAELEKGERRGVLYFTQHCAYCSGGLGFSKCEWCGNEFPEEKRFKLDWSDIPLPAKITDCLISYGFKFQKDPQIARDKEEKRFREGYEIRAPALTHFRQEAL